jgi:hypothetical protein
VRRRSGFFSKDLLTSRPLSEYHGDMPSELSPPPGTQTVDLTGLPEPVAQGIRQLVRALRDDQGGQETGPSTAGRREPSFVMSRPYTSPDEFERLLDEFSCGRSGRVLPPDFSRADIYDDHD